VNLLVLCSSDDVSADESPDEGIIEVTIFFILPAIKEIS
jgi:hypothetical protein